MQAYIATGQKTGKTCIETISTVYGAQAVVISVDPKRVYVASPDDVSHHVVPTKFTGPKGECFCWYVPQLVHVASNI
jgi:glutamine amidotransferase/cyclase